MLPRTSLYCTTVSQNSIIPVPNFYAPVTFFSTSPYSRRFHCDLSPSLIGWEFITYKFVCSVGFRRREKDFCGLYLEIFLSIISRRCFAYFAVDRLFTRLSSVWKGILFSLFSSVPFELELLKESSQFQFIYGILKRHTSVSIAKHGAFISLMLCRSDTIKKCHSV